MSLMAYLTLGFWLGFTLKAGADFYEMVSDAVRALIAWVTRPPLASGGFVSPEKWVQPNLTPNMVNTPTRDMVVNVINKHKGRG